MATLKVTLTKSSNFTEKEIHGFIQELRNSIEEDIEIQEFEVQQRGYAVTWWEVIKVILEDVPGEIRGAIVSEILRVGIKTIKESFKRKDKQIGRPNSITIYDEKGNEIETRVISSSRQKPRTAEEYKKWSMKEYEKTKKSKKTKKKK